jgi:peptide deformylase
VCYYSLMSKHRQGFAYPNDPILLKKAEMIPVDEITSSKTAKIIERMLAKAHPEQGDKSKPILVGLAAPQVKISKRIILVDVKAEGHGVVGDLRVYINPKIIWKSKDKEEWYEGCYLTDRVCGIVSRPKTIKIRAYNKEGNRVGEKHSGYVARIFQHEIDHLNGIEFVSHIRNDDKLHWVEEDEFPVYRNSEGWRKWPKKCPREKWEKIKGINKQAQADSDKP